MPACTALQLIDLPRSALSLIPGGNHIRRETIMIKKIATLLFLATFLFCSTERVQKVSAGGGGGMFRVITIPAAAFRPNQDGYTYDNAGYWLKHSSFGNICPSGCEADYYAPVHLPHTAVITGMTAYIEDNNTTYHATVDLMEGILANGSVSFPYIASVSSPAGINSGFTPYSQSGLSYGVDNANHAYYLRYSTPMEQTSSDEINLGGVQISYIEYSPANPSYFSLTGADFTPFADEVDYSNSGVSLENDLANEWDFQAGVVLPNGARLDRMTFYYREYATKTVSANLCRVYNYSGDYTCLSSLASTTGSGFGSATSTVFSSNIVNNIPYAYWLFYRFEAGPIPFGVVIQYTPKIYSTDERYFSIPAASFVPRNDTYSYENHGRYLKHFSGGDSNGGAYMAPFAPPSGSSVTYMSFKVGNSANSTPGELLLLRSAISGTLHEMWSQYTLTIGGWYEMGSSNISRHPIDYSHNAYYLRFNLPPSTVGDWVTALGARGEWAYRGYLPEVRK
jgi:hypothetical protein